MKIIPNMKIFILWICFLALCFNGVANDTLRFTANWNWTVTSFITASFGKPFTVDWGDGSGIETFTGTGARQSLGHEYEKEPNHYIFSITVAGTDEDCVFSEFDGFAIYCFDASKAPSLIEITLHGTWYGTLDSVNLQNCSKLEVLCLSNMFHNSLNSLDLRDCTSLKRLFLDYNKLSTLDISNTAAEICHASFNCLPLSQLYPVTKKLPHPEWSYNHKHVTATRFTTVNVPVDFSSEKEFEGTATYFLPRYGYGLESWPPASESDYTINDGFITFHTARTFTVYMENSKIIGRDGVYTLTPVIVMMPVQEIINLPATAVVGTPLFLSGTVVPDNASRKGISWSIFDAGTTGATIQGSRLHTQSEGTVIVTATIINGLGMYNDYQQNFTVEVILLGVDDSAQTLSMIKVYPNPANNVLNVECGELRVEKIEILDVLGKITDSSVYPFLHASNISIDISQWLPGTYFVKIVTMQGEIVQTVVKR